MEKNIKKTPPIQSLEIRIDSDSTTPHIVLNGLDLGLNQIKLRGVAVIWKTFEGVIPENLIEINYLQEDNDGTFRDVTISQSFPNSIIKKE